MNDPVHIAITRTVKPGAEQEFEQAVLEFFSKTADFPGSLGTQLIRPLPGAENGKFGILRSFVSRERQNEFYQSAAFADWVDKIKPLVEDDYERETLPPQPA